VHVSVRRAELAETAGVFVVLGGDEVDVFQDALRQPADPLVAAKALLAEAAVDDGYFGTVSLSGRDQVRP
jgi:hypothetical protein